MVGLLGDADHPLVRVEGRHPQMAQVLVLLHRCEQDAGSVGVGGEGVDHRFDGPFDDVVGQHDQHRVAVDEPGGQPEGLGDAAGLLLIAVAEPVDAELVAVPQQAQELPGVGSPGHQHDLGDPGVDQRLDAPVDHRPVVDRQQVLVGDPGQRMQPRAGPPGQDDALHGPQPRRAGRGRVPAVTIGPTPYPASTASARTGHDRAAHGPNGRSHSPAQMTPATGSIHTNEPDWPKCPKVDGRVGRPGPVRLLVAPDLHTEAPVARIEPLEAGEHTTEAGELDGDHLDVGLGADQRGHGQFATQGEQIGERAGRARPPPPPRSVPVASPVPVMPRGSSTPSCR